MNSSGLVHFLHPNSCFKPNVNRRSYDLVKPALRIRGHRPDSEYSLTQPTAPDCVLQRLPQRVHGARRGGGRRVARRVQLRRGRGRREERRAAAAAVGGGRRGGGGGHGDGHPGGGRRRSHRRVHRWQRKKETG